MIDFKNAKYAKLKQISSSGYEDLIQPLFIKDEYIVQSYKTIRDRVIFTNKRIIAINIQGITGKKKDFTSLPYSNIQVYSVESAGVLDMDSELTLWFSGLGLIKFEFTRNANVTGLCRLISSYVL